MPQIRPKSAQEGPCRKFLIGAKLRVSNQAHVQKVPRVVEAEKAALYWVGTFYRMHSEATPYIPVLFKLADCPLRGDDGLSVKRKDGQPAITRYLWEIAVQRSGQRPRWYFILWGIDDYSLRIRKCRTLHEAKAIYEKPASYVLELKAPGVRLRKEYVPDDRANSARRM